MRIEINPRSLLNLEHICEVLYKLHPRVLDDLVKLERSLGLVLGFIDNDNLSLEEREFLANIHEEKDLSIEMENDEDLSKEMENDEDYKKLFESIKSREEDPLVKLNSYKFHNLRKYIQLDTDEYIPIKISIEVEDPVIGKKVRELVRALEKTRAPEQFYLNKKEMDEDAYFAEGYDLSINEEQKKRLDNFFWGEDVEGLEELLRKEKLYP